MASTSSTVQAISTFNFELITNALVDYTKTTGIDLSKNPFTAALKRADSQLPQPGDECHSDVLGHSTRGGQPGKSELHIPSVYSLNVTSSGPLPTGKGNLRWD